MAQIHILDAETIDKIAAGEVVERPSSVVKELVENAIDAGATAVTVEAKDGGIELIRVTDNGCGMERNQLRTAFLRHATSKIEDAGDLLRISSLGFRGEALSSIAAVAKVEVITKVADSMTGSRILLEGAREVGFDEVGAPDGTTFVVRNLFFNTPARLKFLKQPITEGGYIASLMEHLALSRPDISFKFLLGGQMKFHTSGNGDLREVIYRIYGREVAAALVPIQAEQGGIRIEGYLGKPVQVRSNRNYEIYFINGRFIRSNVVARALEEGYKEYLMQHKFPLCVLHITMDTARVDVNVHPTKMDVRFSDAISFCNFVAESVRHTLQHQEMIPEALLATEQELRAARLAEKKEEESKVVPEPFERVRTNAYVVMEEAKYTREHPSRQDFSRNPVWDRVRNAGGSQDKMDDECDRDGNRPMENQCTGEEICSMEGKSTMERESSMEGEHFMEDGHSMERKFSMEEKDSAESAEQFGGRTSEKKITGQESQQSSAVNVQTDVRQGPSVCAVEEHAEEFFTETSEFTDDESVAVQEESGKADSSDVSGIVQLPENTAPFANVAGVQMDLFEDKILTADNRRRFRVIGQVFGTYWLIEFEEKLLMMDQHAAHEKVNYERLMRQYREKAVVSQSLMPPVIVSLSGQEEAVLKEHLDVFRSLGFEVEGFGGSEYALRSVPMDLYGCDEREMFLEVLDGLSEGGGAFGSIRVIEEKIASMSCKAAVKGNSCLSYAEAEALIDELLTLDNPYNCPHGRPTIVTMSKSEMDRKFKRIVS